MGSAQSQSEIYPFTPSTQKFDFSEWIAIFTVTLAPLIAHIAAGTPQPSILTRPSRGPKWHDSICLYNPTSIIWRYSAIADRRIRAKDWSAADMAATNALFWLGTPTRKRRNASTSHPTFDDREGIEASPQRAQDPEHALPEEEFHGEQGGWNGTEEMILGSLPYCTQLPLHTRAELLSWETIKTIIITLQGMQSLSILVGGLSGIANGSNTGIPDAVDIIFAPFTLIGLFRLCAAGYLISTGFAYVSRDDAGLELPERMTDPCTMAVETGGNGGGRALTTAQMHHGGHAYFGVRGDQHLQQDSNRHVANGVIILSNDQEISRMADSTRYHSMTYIPSIIFRCTYMLFVILICVISLLRGTPALKMTKSLGRKQQRL